jgi:ankyrin repeat protein
MSDALPLPARPNIEQYKKLAKDFQQACKAGDPAALQQWVVRWAETLAGLQERAAPTGVHWIAERVERQWRRLQKSNQQAAGCTLAGAQLFIARCHGFASWPKFTKHLEALGASSPVSHFEAAVDAIVSGNIATLEKLLRDHPELIRMRSTREHRSTLLHYVSANGVEDFRQKTPANIVEITTMLVDAGADVNAESEAYGGRSTTLGLTATSCHPEDAGVQLPLMDLLIRHGARIDGPDGGSAVNGCLHNGRAEAAEFFADRGARLDLEAAAGVGRLDVVRRFFNADGRLLPPATPKQMHDGFAWACEFGRTSVVDFLLRHGIGIDTKLPHDGQTGLHWAAYGGHAETVKLLLERGAPVNTADESYGGTPLEWALYAWGNSPRPTERGSYFETVALLARAGAKLHDEWFREDDEERQRAVRKLHSDPKMLAALRGEIPKK